MTAAVWTDDVEHDDLVFGIALGGPNRQSGVGHRVAHFKAAMVSPYDGPHAVADVGRSLNGVGGCYGRDQLQSGLTRFDGTGARSGHENLL